MFVRQDYKCFSKVHNLSQLEVKVEDKISFKGSQSHWSRNWAACEQLTGRLEATCFTLDNDINIISYNNMILSRLEATYSFLVKIGTWLSGVSRTASKSEESTLGLSSHLLLLEDLS